VGVCEWLIDSLIDSSGGHHATGQCGEWGIAISALSSCARLMIDCVPGTALTAAITSSKARTGKNQHLSCWSYTLGVFGVGKRVRKKLGV
jgi:hypothetical protein